MSLVSKAFSDIITFSRSSNATRIGPDGLVQYAPHNLLVRSQEFNLSWIPQNSTVVSNSAAAPDGSISADLVYPNTSGTYRGIYQAFTASDSVYTVSVYAKAAGFNFLYFINFEGNSAILWVDLSNGTTSAVPGGYTVSTTNAGSGWWRISITKSTAAGTRYVQIQVSDSSESLTATANGTSGIYLWGAQLAVGPYALDYTPTTSAAVYGPRFDYDPVTLAARGLLVEEQRTNLLTYSEQFDNAAWAGAVTDGSVSANATTSPDGTVNADLFIPNTSSSATHRTIQFITTSSGTFNVSVYAKAAGYSRFFVFAGGANQSAVFDLTTQTVVADTRFAAAPSNMTITAIGNGWYWCSFSTNISAAVTNVQITVLNSTANPGDSWTGNGTSGIYIWGAQLEAGSFATSYIPTLASTVTRSADVASVNTLSPWYSSSESTLFAEFDITGAGNPQTIASMQASAAADGLLLYKSGSGFNMQAYVDASFANLGAVSLNTAAKVALAYNGSANGAVLNGGSVSSVGTTVSAAATKLSIGASFNGTSNKLNGHIRRIAYYPRRLSNAELQALTA